MLTVAAIYDLALLYFVAFNVAAILAYVLVLKRRERRAQLQIATITGTVTQFFSETGANVTIECVGKTSAGHIVLIDTGSSKRFRYSHVVEIILADHVRERCGLVLQRVYWRFPLNEARDASLPVKGEQQVERIAEDVDAYLSEGLLRLRDTPGYEVKEGSLENYREEFARLMARDVAVARTGGKTASARAGASLAT